MNNLEQLESYAKDLASAVKKFSDHCRSTEIDSITAALPVVPVETDDQVQQARRNILATVAKIQALIRKPEDFLQNLASQVRPSPRPIQLRIMRWTPYSSCPARTADPAARKHTMAW
jgi:hypothetical protein